MDDAHDRLTDEARATASALLDWLGSRVDRAAAPGGPGARPAQSPGPCTWCPVCAVVAALRGEQPELTARVAEQASGLMMLLRLMVQSHAGPVHEHGHEHGDLGWPADGWDVPPAPEEPATAPGPADDVAEDVPGDVADDAGDPADVAEVRHRAARPTPRRAPARTTSPRTSAPRTSAPRATVPSRPARGGRTGPRPAPRRSPVDQPTDATTNAPASTPTDRPADPAPPTAPAASPEPRPGQRRPVQRIPIRRPSDPSP